MILILGLLCVIGILTTIFIPYYKWKKTAEFKKAKNEWLYASDRAFFIDEECPVGCIVLFATGLIICICATAFLIGALVSGKQLDNKIALYQEANRSIESKIENSITDYMGYEKDMFQNLDINAIVMKYPELKTNELVQEELKVYQENNKKIVELKEQKIELNARRWWLYFGWEDEEENTDPYLTKWCLCPGLENEE